MAAIPFPQYILLCGVIRYPTILSFLSQVYAYVPTMEYGEMEYCVVILSPLEVTRRITTLLESSKYSNRVLYFRGSAKNHDDLRQIKTERFLSIVMMQSSDSLEGESSFLTAISVIKYLGQFDSKKPSTSMKITSTGKGKVFLAAKGGIGMYPSSVHHPCRVLMTQPHFHGARIFYITWY